MAVQPYLLVLGSQVLQPVVSLSAGFLQTLLIKQASPETVQAEVLTPGSHSAHLPVFLSPLS